MTPAQLQDFRVQRLQTLMDSKFEGQKVALGRALGHKSGAFVRQMLDKERPITEKTVQAVERLPGCSGWFDVSNAPPDEVRLDMASSEPPRDEVQRALLVIRNQLVHAHGDTSAAVGDALRLLALTPDSDRAFHNAVDFLVALPTGAGKTSTVIVDTKAPQLASRLEMKPGGDWRESITSPAVSVGDVLALAKRVAMGNNNPRELALLMEFLNLVELKAKQETGQSPAKLAESVKNHDG